MRRYAGCLNPHVPIRFAPSTCAGIAGKIAPGQVVVASARRGPWVRLVEDDQREGLERWALTCHPILGRLLQPVGFEEEPYFPED